jgi:hypothetical protein
MSEYRRDRSVLTLRFFFASWRLCVKNVHKEKAISRKGAKTRKAKLRHY